MAFGLSSLMTSGHGDNTHQSAVPAEKQRGFPFRCKPVGNLRSFFGNLGVPADKFQVAAADQRTVDLTGQSVARYSLKVFCLKLLLSAFLSAFFRFLR